MFGNIVSDTYLLPEARREIELSDYHKPQRMEIHVQYNGGFDHVQGFLEAHPAGHDGYHDIRRNFNGTKKKIKQ